VGAVDGIVADWTFMNNKNTEEFFEKLLGFGPDWGVASIELLDDGSTVELGLEHRREGAVECPECGKICALHDHARERRWRHLDMLQYETRIRARIPRCECPECGVHQIKVPWAEPNARFTLLFEAHAIEVLQAARSTTQACDLLGIGWSTADAIMKRAVQRGMERRETEEIPRVGMDEKSFRARHRYITEPPPTPGLRREGSRRDEWENSSVSASKALEGTCRPPQRSG